MISVAFFNIIKRMIFLLNLSYDSLESLGVVYCEVSKNLTVNLDSGLVESTHQY